MPFITSHLQVANFLMKSQSTTHLHYLVSKLVTISQCGTMKRSFQKDSSLQTKCQKIVSYLGTNIDLQFLICKSCDNWGQIVAYLFVRWQCSWTYQKAQIAIIYTSPLFYFFSKKYIYPNQLVGVLINNFFFFFFFFLVGQPDRWLKQVHNIWAQAFL